MAGKGSIKNPRDYADKMAAVAVSISWVSFWIDPSAVPGRVTLGGVTLLAISAQAEGVYRTILSRAVLPPTRLLMFAR